MSIPGISKKKKKELSDKASHHGTAMSGLEKVSIETNSGLCQRAPGCQGPRPWVLSSLHTLSQS